MDVVLVNPIPEDDFLSFIPLGLCSIGTVLKERGYEVKVIDMRWHKKEKMWKNVEKTNFVGFGPICSMQMSYALYLAKSCKLINENCREIRDRNLHNKVIWECESRADTFNESIASQLKRSECYSVW